MPWIADFPEAARMFWGEIVVRMLLITSFIITENVEPFWRIIQQDEVWLYSYPTTVGYVTTLTLYMIVISTCLSVIGFFFYLNRNYREAWDALLVPSLAIPLCGTITNFVKISVGRPRPDYFARCVPGVQNILADMACTGDPDKVLEGRKSFPSGHSSMSFCAMGFVALYLAGKLGVFNSRGRGQSYKLVIVLTPLIGALMVAISRTCDYHHHYQDVTIGSILGILVVYSVYRQYYPCLSAETSYLCYSLLPSTLPRVNPQSAEQGSSSRKLNSSPNVLTQLATGSKISRGNKVPNMNIFNSAYRGPRSQFPGDPDANFQNYPNPVPLSLSEIYTKVMFEASVIYFPFLVHLFPESSPPNANPVNIDTSPKPMNNPRFPFTFRHSR